MEIRPARNRHMFSEYRAPLIGNIVNRYGRCPLVEYDGLPELEDEKRAPELPKIERRVNDVAATDSEKKEQARRYLQKVDPAIEGQHGDDATYRIACSLRISPYPTQTHSIYLKNSTTIDAGRLGMSVSLNRNCPTHGDMEHMRRVKSFVRIHLLTEKTAMLRVGQSREMSL